MTGKKIDVGPVGKRVANNVSAIRHAKRLQYKELSDLMGSAGRPIAPLGIRRIEEQERRVDAQDLATLAEVLGIPPEKLMFSDVTLKAEYKMVGS